MSDSNPTFCSCGGATLVEDTRTTHGAIRRRRACAHCGRKFTTYEVVLPEIGDSILVRRVAGGLTFSAVAARPAIVLDSPADVVGLAPKRGKK